MKKKNGIKHKIAYAAYQNSDLNKRAITLKKSLDEVNKLINPRNTK